jgi:hypothetical protein
MLRIDLCHAEACAGVGAERSPVERQEPEACAKLGVQRQEGLATAPFGVSGKKVRVARVHGPIAGASFSPIPYFSVEIHFS